MSTKEILVVDDEPAVTMVLQELLESSGYAVSLATTCGEGIERLEAGNYHLVLVDKNLPDRSGMEVIRHVSEMAAGPEAIMMTGYGSLESAIEAMDLGARGYILKPFEDVDEILDKISKVLAAAEERQRMRSLIDDLRATNAEAGQKKD